jgi:hypothetical protein
VVEELEDEEELEELAEVEEEEAEVREFEDTLADEDDELDEDTELDDCEVDEEEIDLGSSGMGIAPAPATAVSGKPLPGTVWGGAGERFLTSRFMEWSRWSRGTSWASTKARRRER